MLGMLHPRSGSVQRNSFAFRAEGAAGGGGAGLVAPPHPRRREAARPAQRGARERFFEKKYISIPSN